MNDILAVIVHYKSQPAAIATVASLSRLPMRLFIVDNASGDEHTAELRKLPGFIGLHTNLGYLGAAKFGIAEYLRQGNKLPPWIIVSNADILIEDDRFAETLLAFNYQDCGLIAPRITTPDCIEQNPFMCSRPSPMRRLAMRIQNSNYPVALAWDTAFKIRRTFKRNGHSAAGPIYAPHGSFLIFSRRYFDAGGGLDDHLFLYGEEIATGEMCYRLNLPVLYEPSLQVIHAEHQSIGQRLTWSKFSHHRRSMNYVLDAYLME